jgi:hypothetical protein
MFIRHKVGVEVLQYRRTLRYTVREWLRNSAALFGQVIYGILRRNCYSDCAISTLPSPIPFTPLLLIISNSSLYSPPLPCPALQNRYTTPLLIFSHLVTIDKVLHNGYVSSA